MSNLDIALNLAGLGYYVHPLQERDKIPLAMHGYNDATRDAATIRAWWQERPHANVGINLHKTGVVDVAPDSPEWAARFKARGLPYTTHYASGGGAGHWHTWYRLPKDGPVARACVPGQYDVMSEGNAVAPGSVHPSGRAYELHTRLLAVEDLPLAPGWVIELLQAHVSAARVDHDAADWQNLPSGATLASSARFRALVKANAQLQAVVSGEGVTLTLKDGGKDGSPSIQRAVFVNQLIRARYPHSEIRALALHFAGVLESKPKWFKTDIDNLLRPIDQDGYTPLDYAPEATRGKAQAQEPLRGGRHYEITAAELLDAYHQHADCGRRGLVLDWTIADAAERLNVSTGTIKRREQELSEAGRIKREYGIVILSPATWDTGSQCTTKPNAAAIEAEQPIGSQPDIAQQNAVNLPKTATCIEHAHDEITHPPVAPTIVSVGTPDARGMCVVRWSDGSATWKRVNAYTAEPYTVTEWHDEPARFTVTAWMADGPLSLPGEYGTLGAARAALPPPPEPDEPLLARYVDVLDWTQPHGVCAVPRGVPQADYERPDWMRAPGSLSGDWTLPDEPEETAEQLGFGLAPPGGIGECVLSPAAGRPVVQQQAFSAG